MNARLIAAVGVVAAATVSCVSPDDPGLQVVTVQADIVFGVPDPEAQPIVPPAVSVYVPPGPGAAPPPPVAVVPFRNRIPDRFAQVPFETPQPEVECPTAPLGTGVIEEAPTGPTEVPEEGAYRYKVSGEQRQQLNGVDLPPVPIAAFQPRLVRNVEVLRNGPQDPTDAETPADQPTRWSFEVVSPTGDGGTTITTYTVEADPLGRQVNPPYVGENPVRVGQADRGIAITSIEQFDAAGNQTGSFAPMTPLLVLPLPVLTGENYSSVAIDRVGQTIRVDGDVQRKQFVDACGVYVDGWLVSLAVTDTTGGRTSVRQEEMIFATQLGGLPISHRIVETVANPAGSTTTDVTYSVGQAEPLPLPEGAEA